jgi:hypothetical protein
MSMGNITDVRPIEQVRVVANLEVCLATFIDLIKSRHGLTVTWSEEK